MIRLAATAVILGALMVPAHAEQHDLSRIPCDNPDFVKLMLETIPKARFEDGSRLSQFVDVKQIESIKTIASERNRLSCQLRLSIRFPGDSRKVRALFTIRQFSGGKLSSTIEFQ